MYANVTGTPDSCIWATMPRVFLAIHAVEAREARLAERIDDRARRSCRRPTALPPLIAGLTYFAPKRRLEAGVAARLVGQRVRFRVRIAGADAAAFAQWMAMPDEVGLGQRSRGGPGRRDLRGLALVPLGRALAEDRGHVAGRVGRVRRRRSRCRACALGQRRGERDAGAGGAGRAHGWRPWPARRDARRRSRRSGPTAKPGRRPATLMFVAPAAASAASDGRLGEPGAVDRKITELLFSRTVFATPTLPTSQPARYTEPTAPGHSAPRRFRRARPGRR